MIVIPAHLQEISKTLALQTWVTNRRLKFPLEKYFETIDDYKKVLADRHASRLEPGESPQDPRIEVVVNMVAATLDHEGALLKYVLDTATYSLDTEDREMRWFRVCQAAAWAVVQAHERECHAGRWPKT